MSLQGIALTSLQSVIGPDGQRLLIGETDEAIIRRLSPTGVLRCPHCGSIVHYRHGKVRAPYFYHKADPCEDRYGEPDGPAHQAMKRVMLAWLRRQPGVTSADMEVTLETRQRADVLATCANGQRVAVEVQRSPLSDAGWEERHDLYASVQVRDLWLLHPMRANLIPRHDPEQTPSRLRAIGGRAHTALLDDLTLSLVRHGVTLAVLDAEHDDPTITFLVLPRHTGRRPQCMTWQKRVVELGIRKRWNEGTGSPSNFG